MIKAGTILTDELIKTEARQSDEVILEAGTYYLPYKGIELDDSFSGKIFICKNGTARLVGGIRLDSPSTLDESQYKLFPLTDSPDEILVYSLAGVKNICGFSSRGFARTVNKSHSEVFADSKPLNITRYPKGSRYLHISGFSEKLINEWDQEAGKLSEGFYFDDKHTLLWNTDRNNIWVHGYWGWDWANSHEEVDYINKETGFVRNKEPYGNYYFKKGQRFNFFNVLEELTEPGDYYIDPDNKLLYMLPFEDHRSGEIVLSTLDRPLISIRGAKNISVENIICEAVCSSGLKISDSENIKIKNCIFRNTGNTGITIGSSENIEITCCDIHDCGDGGISAQGGDRTTLKPCGININNCHIYNIAKWSRCYQTGINITGVGITAKNNLIHDCPHIGILFWGNDISIENNEIYSVCLETGDAGGIYIGRDYSFRGNSVCNNYLHHFGGVGMGTMGIYNDDCVSGTKMTGNFFEEVQRAVFLGGGRDFIVENNVFVNCYPSIDIDGRGTSSHQVWQDMINILMKERFYNIRNTDDTNMSVESESLSDKVLSMYLSKYPEMKDIDEFYKNPCDINGKKITLIPPSARIHSNVYHSERKLEMGWDSECGEFDIKDNFSVSADDFVSLKYHDLEIRKCSPAVQFGHIPVDFSKIGLQDDLRCDPVPKVISRLAADHDTGSITVTFKNLRSSPVDFTYELLTDPADPILNKRTSRVALGGGEEKVIIINSGDLSRLKGTSIDLRSALAGIRPCRINLL